MRVRKFVVAAAAALSVTGCVPLGSSSVASYRPPSGSGAWAELDLRRDDGSQVFMADPDVIRVQDRWYLYGTTSSARGSRRGVQPTS